MSRSVFTRRVIRIGYFLLVLIAFLIGRYGNTESSVALAQEAGGPKAAQEKLEEMNEALDKLIENYGNGLIGELGLQLSLPAIKGMKIQAISHFPRVYGHRFDEWYVPLESLDRHLELASSIAGDIIAGRASKEEGKKAILEALGDAKERKEKVEGMLPPKK